MLMRYRTGASSIRGSNGGGELKTAIGDLAIVGGKPLFDERLYIGRPFVGDKVRLLERISDAIERRSLTNDGPYVQEFAERLQVLSGARHVIPLVNGTTGLEVAARALGLSGEVIVPSFTFIATAHALQWQGITPVFCDVDPDTHNIDPTKIEALITPRTRGIIGVHLWGRPCDTDAIGNIARRYGLRVLYDAAHAFNVSHLGRKLGNFGNAEVFSFHATKFINTLEGGAIATNDDDLAESVRQMIKFGFTDSDSVVRLGINGKMNEFCAAMGLTALDAMSQTIATNQQNYEAYRGALSDIPGIRFIAYDPDTAPNYQYIVAEIDEAQFGLSRDALMTLLHAENLMVRRYFYPGCHRSEPYRSTLSQSSTVLPVTERLAAQILCFPCGAGMNPSLIRSIGNLMRFVSTHAMAVRSLSANVTRMSA
jgi:dTDP-4-amino-4,6-dideoxygalactose transaminase